MFHVRSDDSETLKAMLHAYNENREDQLTMLAIADYLEERGDRNHIGWRAVANARLMLHKAANDLRHSDSVVCFIGDDESVIALFNVTSKRGKTYCWIYNQSPNNPKPILTRAQYNDMHRYQVGDRIFAVERDVKRNTYWICTGEVSKQEM